MHSLLPVHAPLGHSRLHIYPLFTSKSCHNDRPSEKSLKRGRCARSVKNSQTWNGERPRKQLYEGQACQVCQNSADLERGPATEAALRGAGVPGLSKLRRPGTERGHGSSSTRGRCARSVKNSQTWNRERPRKQLYEGQVRQVCQNSANLERGPAQ